MRVLWFSNSPANASELLLKDIYTGGWLVSLDKAIQHRVELHNAFYYPKTNESFKYLNTSYHPIGEKYWKFLALKEIFWKNYKDIDDLPVYLKIIDEVKPDIIHIHGTENPFGCISGKTKIPVVISIQGIITVYQHKFLSGIEKEYLHTRRSFAGKSLKEIIFNTDFYDEYRDFIKYRHREEQNLLRAEYIIGRTDWDRRVTSILAPESHYFICNEMLRDPFYEAEWSPHGHRKTIIIHTTNSNCFYKGLETLCLALFYLNKTGLSVEWRIAGVSENDLIVSVVKKKLKKMFPSNGLKFLGPVNENILLNKLLEADIYVMPSHIENSPNNLCEAMILGIPCIATYAGGTGSLLKDGEEGILIQDGDPWALAGAIVELQRNHEKAVSLGRQARERALARHARETITNCLIDIYKNIIDMNS